MNYGLHISAAGALNGMFRLDVASNNLANVNTPAFKMDMSMPVKRETAFVEDGLFHMETDRLLERLGGGSLAGPTRTSFAPSAPLETGNPLDVTILEKGFFVLDSGEGEGAAAQRFTRDGRFTLDARGRLVSATSGMSVVDEQGAPIRLRPDAPATITPSGDVMQGGARVARLQVVNVTDETALFKTSDNMYALQSGASPELEPSGSPLRSGAVESSAVDPVRALMAVTDASGFVRNNLRMIRAHDEVMSRAINTFARTG